MHFSLSPPSSSSSSSSEMKSCRREENDLRSLGEHSRIRRTNPKDERGRATSIIKLSRHCSIPLFTPPPPPLYIFTHLTRFFAHFPGQQPKEVLASVFLLLLLASSVPGNSNCRSSSSLRRRPLTECTACARRSFSSGRQTRDGRRRRRRGR